MEQSVQAMFVRCDEGRFTSTVHAQGAWNEHEIHMGPASGLLAHVLESHPRPEGLRIARISYEILGLMPAGDLDVSVTVERPGRTIQLVRADMTGQDGRVCLSARAWLLATSGTGDIAGHEDEPMPAREDCSPSDPSALWPGGYIAQLEGYQWSGTRPGRGKTWLRSTVPLIHGEAAPFGEFIRDLDAANGMAPRVRPGVGGLAYPNIDLQVHLFRQPQGDWKGIDSRVAYGPDGVGLTSSVISDAAGVVGHTEQILTLRRAGA